MGKWPVIVGIVLALLPLACGDEKKDSDDDPDAPAVIRSCDDMPPDDFGDAVPFETLRCGDKEMKGFVSGAWSGAGTDRLFTDLIESQDDLDAMLEWTEFDPCPVNFDQYEVLSARWEYPQRTTEIYADVEICSVRGDEKFITARVFVNTGHGLELTDDGTTFHLARIAESPRTVVFEPVIYDPETDSNL